MRRIAHYPVVLCFTLLFLISTDCILAQDFEELTVAAGVPAGWGVTAGDFDGDGDIDIAATSKVPGRIVWYETRFNETPIDHFLYSVGGSGSRYIASADFDNDDDLDLIVAGYGENRFIWFENRGADYPDRFEIHSLLEDVSGAWQAIPLDLNNNGTNDIAICGYNGNTVALMLTSTSGEHSVLSSFTVADPIGLHAVDYDRDGDMDLLIASSSTTQGGIYWLEQTSPLQFELQGLFIESGLRPTSLCTADLDNDEDIDIIATRIGDSDGVTWWENTDEELIPHDLNGFMYLPRSVVAADFDDDNLIDIAATWHGSSAGSGGVYWWRNTGNGTFPQSVIHDGESPYDLHLADFDLDGDQDLLSPLSGRGEVVLFRNLLGVSALILGAVTSDAEDLPLSDILVTIRETGNSDLTDSAGSYVMNAAPGFYTIDFEHACWEDLRFEAVAAIEDSITVLNAALRRPILSVSHSSLNIQAYNAVETITPLLVSNRGDADLTIHADVMDSGIQDGWLSISPIDTMLPPGAEAVFSVSIAPDTSNLSAWDYYGEIELYSNSCPDTVLEIPVFVHVLDTRNEHPVLPMRTMLHPVYPNPFNSSTRICYDLAVAGRVDLKLFDIQGRQAASLFSAFAEAGTHNMEFNGSDFASGIYFLRLTSGHENCIQKLHLLK